MYDADRPRPVGYRVLNQTLVNVLSVGPDIDEYRLGSAQQKSIRRRGEGERRHDDFVAWLKTAQDCGDVQRCRARRRNDRFRCFETGLNESLDAAAK